MRKLSAIALIVLAATMTTGCLAGAVIGTAGAVVGTTAKVAVKTTGAVVGAAIPDDEDEDDDKR